MREIIAFNVRISAKRLFRTFRGWIFMMLLDFSWRAKSKRNESKIRVPNLNTRSPDTAQVLPPSNLNITILDVVFSFFHNELARIWYVHSISCSKWLMRYVHSKWLMRYVQRWKTSRLNMKRTTTGAHVVSITITRVLDERRSAADCFLSVIRTRDKLKTPCTSLHILDALYHLSYVWERKKKLFITTRASVSSENRNIKGRRVHSISLLFGLSFTARNSERSDARMPAFIGSRNKFRTRYYSYRHRNKKCMTRADRKTFKIIFPQMFTTIGIGKFEYATIGIAFEDSMAGNDC